VTMPSPKDIKKIFKTTQGTKAVDKMDLSELLASLPKGSKAQQLEAELMFKRLAEEQAARYAPTNPPTKRGNAALAEAKKTLAKKQAPAVIIPSKISNVERAVRESKGEYGARRVQRAADEISDLERLYTEEALRQAFGGDNAKALMVMNPNDFQGFAHPLEMSERRIAGHDPSKATMPTSDYIKHLSGISEFHDVPFLQINKEEQGLPLIPFITGHEGRHRNRAMAERGDPAGLVQLLPRAELREPFPRRDQEEYLEALRKELEMTDNLVIPEKYLAPSDESSFGNWIYRPAIKLPEIFADGGGVHMAGGGKALKALKALRGADKAADATQDVKSIVSAGKPLTAAERAMVGRLAAEYTANQPVIRLSEALGNVGAEGKNLRVTQTDRTGAKYLGGAPFSMMQKVDPRYAESKATWGVKTRSAATNIINQSDPDVIWSTLIGSKTQHRSNELIFDKLYKAFQKSAKEGNLSPELRTKFNAALEPIFGEGADILDPKLRKEIDTFEKRAIVGNLLLGKDIGGATRGGSIIPGLKIMSETTEPMLKGVETFSIGPRLFTLDQGVTTRPDMHPAFPEILTGQDLNQLFTPVPNRIALPTFNEDFRARTGRKKPGYYELTNTPEGDPYPTQFVDEGYLNFLQREGYAEGGVVRMQGGGDPGEVSGNTFAPKPLTIPSPLTDLADMIRRQFSKEKRTSQKSDAATDVALRGPVAYAAGAPMDLAEMAGMGIDYLQTRIPGLRTNASVMDAPRSVVDKRPADTNYEPKIKFSPEPKVHPSLPFDASQYIQTNDPKLRAFINRRQKEINSSPQLPIVEEARMPYGTEDFQKRLNQAGLTTDEERPLFELATAILAPGAALKALKYGKALAPTAADIMETQLLRATEPMRMNIVPDGGPSGKLKAPANDLGFYNPAEKAALNLQRKKGTGATFVSDLKKQPGVNDERLAELGLGDLATRPNVTREELLAATEQNRIPLRETVRREGKKTSEEMNDEIYQLKEDMSYMDSASREWAEADRALTRLLKENDQEEKVGRAMFGPSTSPDYNLPGGQNYREIRVALPSNERPMSYEEWKKSGSNEPWSSKGVVGENFYNSTHHGDEPNVLFHLRVADHADAEGKKGLLIDELQSDWHQQGRKKGYARDRNLEYRPSPEGYEPHPYNGMPGFNFVDKNTGDMYTGYGKTIEEAKSDLKKSLGKSSGVLDAPFKDNWYQLGLKRAIKEAADTGMDRVYLTTGKRQIDRYEDALRKNVDAIEYEPFKGENGELMFEISGIKNGKEVISKDNLTYKELEELVGKDMADKIKNNAGESLAKERPNRPEWMRLSGDDISIGGEGMKQYYDKNYINFLKKYAKQFDAKVGETTLPTAGRKMIDLSSKEIDEITSTPGFIQEMMKLSGGKTAFQMSDDEYRRIFDTVLQKMRPEFGEKVYYIDITPKMRDSAKKGQSYKDGGAVKMAEGGQITFAKANKLLRQHVANMAEGGAVHMAEGGAVDYESRFNDLLQKHVKGMADGGAVKSIWTVN
jgi:hypothetical protein